jgi:hypothetical protein
VHAETADADRGAGFSADEGGGNFFLEDNRNGKFWAEFSAYASEPISTRGEFGNAPADNRGASNQPLQTGVLTIDRR